MIVTLLKEHRLEFLSLKEATPASLHLSKCQTVENHMSRLMNCVVSVCALCFLLMVPFIGMQSLIVAFPSHTHYYVRFFLQ